MFDGRLVSVVHVCTEIFSDLKDLFFLKFVGTKTAGQDWPDFYGMVAGTQREYKAMVVRWQCLVQ